MSEADAPGPTPLRPESLAELAGQVRLRGGIVAIGNFDGVHLGHRALLARMRELGDDERAPTLVVTFFPPAKVLFQGSSYLSSADEKAELLGAFAPDAIVTIPFDHDYARTPKDAFVDELAALAPRTVIVGEDFRFGHGRRGGLDDLAAPDRSVEVFGLVERAGEPVKSTRIRSHLEAGEIASANDLLGAPYRARGPVVEGERRGRQLGYPTANLDLDPRKALPLGVFAVTVDTPSGRYGGMANAGPRPSFPGEPPALEVHVFDFDDDLYGAEIEVYFHAHLRYARAFASLDDLRAQLADDETNARDALAGLGADTVRRA